jgi:methylthioribose-1-phosphate isomerase
MIVRGAPLIGVTAAYGLAIALDMNASDAALEAAVADLAATRPTAVNLRWALDRVARVVRPLGRSARADAAFQEADAIADEDVAASRAIGRHGAALLRELASARPAGEPLRVMTHCNAGWLATVDWGTALAPIYTLQAEGAAVHVWASETRPRNQGLLTEWELRQQGIPVTLVADNACGLLIARSEVDVVLVGSDRTVANGDVCNKIGTYLKALAAREHGVPFVVALPSSTLDLSIASGDAIPIEERAATELTSVPDIRVHNPAFDVTPARFVTKLVTERGVHDAEQGALARAFPELVR